MLLLLCLTTPSFSKAGVDRTTRVDYDVRTQLTSEVKGRMVTQNRKINILRITLIIIAFIIVCVLIGGYVLYRDLTRGPLPQHDGELIVEGLQAPVEVLRDQWGVPHIYAENMHDLFFAQGFTQAQDRWWQMEFWRHIGSGTIEEITGRDNDPLEADILIRSLGWRQIAEREAELCDEETRAYLQAFVDGVNAYITSRNSGDLALEYGVLKWVGKRIEIEPWTIADSLIWGKVMAWSLSSGGNDEETRSIIYELIGQELTDQWMTPQWPFGERPTIIQPEDLDITLMDSGSQVSNEVGVIESQQVASTTNLHDIDPIFDTSRAIGSNNWVVSGNMSESGKPLLANDPHLSIQLPSIWYEIGLHCLSIGEQRPFNVTGFTFAPIPGVVIGHNDFIAWGVTNTGPDVSDLYQIRVNPENPLQYEWNGDWRDMAVRQETISFAGSDQTITIQLRETHLGPIINDNELDEESEEILGLNNEDPLALSWTGLEPSHMSRAVFGLNKAADWDEFRDALQYWDVPSQNFIYADIEGNIGYQMPGRIPIRAENHSGLLPAPGWTDEFEWQGYVPYEYLPNVLNPKQGYIATANQAVVPMEYYQWLAQELGEGYNYIFSLDWDYGYRAQRIVELLEANAPHTIESYQRIQGDNKLISAEEIMPYLAALEFDDAELSETRDWLLDWDCQFNIDSPQAALYAQFWARLMENLFNDQLVSEDLDEEDKAYGSDRDMQATSLLLQDPHNAWWDNATTYEVIETRDDILLQSFQEGYDNTVAALGEYREKWRWGDLHKATFVSNPLGASGVGLIEGMVNRGPFSVGGSMATINNTAWGVGSDEDFEVLWLPSMRMIVDLADFSQSVTVHTTGQSGHPYSPHYDDMIDLWRNIEYHPMLWTREQVEAAAEAKLTLKPAFS
jgi:penicillin amidase